MSEPKLCYVDYPWAYFTSGHLSEQWGDDWNDAPYEHNAGDPYEYREHHKEQGLEPWEIIKIAYDGDVETPGDLELNSGYSVEMINSGAAAWLTTGRYGGTKTAALHAGASIEQFAAFIEAHGGNVYTARRGKQQ
jgi:hypothetical protein